MSDYEDLKPHEIWLQRERGWDSTRMSEFTPNVHDLWVTDGRGRISESTLPDEDDCEGCANCGEYFEDARFYDQQEMQHLCRRCAETINGGPIAADYRF